MGSFPRLRARAADLSPPVCHPLQTTSAGGDQCDLGHGKETVEQDQGNQNGDVQIETPQKLRSPDSQTSARWVGVATQTGKIGYLVQQMAFAPEGSVP